MFSVEGLFDIHIHSGPELLSRVSDDLTLAREAAQAGMRGFAVKAHFESTASRAYYINRLVENFQMIGSITLNYAVGGINPAAVDNCLRQGGKIVWGPSGHSAFHAKLRGGLGHWGGEGRKPYDPKGAHGITVLDEDGDLTDDAKEVLHIIKSHNAVFATSHLSPEEIVKVAKYAGKEKIKLVLTHLGWTPEYNLELGKAVRDCGGTIELCAVTFGGYNSKKTLNDAILYIKEIGSENIVIGSDTGAPRFPKPHESMRVFGQNLINGGIGEENVRQMMGANIYRLLDI